MKKQMSLSNFETLNEQELQNTNGGLLLAIAMSCIVPGLICIVLYGAFMNGYNDGMAAAKGN